MYGKVPNVLTALATPEHEFVQFALVKVTAVTGFVLTVIVIILFVAQPPTPEP